MTELTTITLQDVYEFISQYDGFEISISGTFNGTLEEFSEKRIPVRTVIINDKKIEIFLGEKTHE